MTNDELAIPDFLSRKAHPELKTRTCRECHGLGFIIGKTGIRVDCRKCRKADTAATPKETEMSHLTPISTKQFTPSFKTKKASKKAKPVGKPKKVKAEPKVKTAYRGVYAEQSEAAAKGILPKAPDFTAQTHARFRGKLDEIKKLAKDGNVKALKAFAINPISSSPKALDRYRNLCVIALEAKK